MESRLGNINFLNLIASPIFFRLGLTRFPAPSGTNQRLEIQT